MMDPMNAQVNPMNAQVNPLDFYTRLMMVSADGIQQSLAQTYLLLQIEALVVAALLAALIVAWYALGRLHTAEQRVSQRWQWSWEALAREDPRSWPDWQEAQWAKEWFNEAMRAALMARESRESRESARKGKRR